MDMMYLGEGGDLNKKPRDAHVDVDANVTSLFVCACVYAVLALPQDPWGIVVQLRTLEFLNPISLGTRVLSLPYSYFY